jgi:putative SOS response-associated peptidase YedK
MCGRYAVTLPPEAYRQFYGYVEQPNFPPRYNVAPTQPVAIVHEEQGERHFRLVRWGFLPSWVKDPKGFPLLFNARADALLAKATYRAAMKRRRCIFLADGFYEWRREGKTKTPYLVRRRDRTPLPFAGVWETYHSADGGEMDTAAIVTTDANGTLAALHARMPAILSGNAVAPWLDTDGVAPEAAVTLLKPALDEGIEMIRVSPRLNTVANDDPGVLEPAHAEPEKAREAQSKADPTLFPLVRKAERRS